MRTRQSREVYRRGVRSLGTECDCHQVWSPSILEFGNRQFRVGDWTGESLRCWGHSKVLGSNVAVVVPIVRNDILIAQQEWSLGRQ